MTKLIAGLALLSALAAAQDTDNGKRLFLRNGCYQCHGYAGQGGLNGVRLAQTGLPLAAFTAYVRNPASGGMPPYRAKVMSDKELADVYGYIKTFPPPLPAKSIPLLNISEREFVQLWLNNPLTDSDPSWLLTCVGRNPGYDDDGGDSGGQSHSFLLSTGHSRTNAGN